jgi:hypothetical protein
MNIPAHLRDLNPHIAPKTLKAARLKDEPTESPLEALLMERLAEAGLPTPTREFPFALSRGRKFRFDAAWIEERVAIEVQGGTWTKGAHSSGKGLRRDFQKQNLAVVLGWRVLFCDGEMIRNGEIVETVKQTFELLNTEVRTW